MKELQEETETRTRESKTLALLESGCNLQEKMIMGLDEMPMMYEVLGKFSEFIKLNYVNNKA